MSNPTTPKAAEPVQTRKTVAKKLTKAEEKKLQARRTENAHIEAVVKKVATEKGWKRDTTILEEAAKTADTKIGTATAGLASKQSVSNLAEDLKDVSTGRTAQWIMIALIGLTAVYAVFA